jgi:iron-sulfur cluster repair protein YtfE (RIC family)
MPNKPIKRHVVLQPLSREHHHGLLFCWKIRSGIKHNIEVSRMQGHATWFWKTHLFSHFAKEEAVVFPVLGKDNELIQQALAEHVELKNMFSTVEMDYEFLNYLQIALEKHIRFEERILFNKIQEVANDDELAFIEKHNSSGEEKLDWDDEYWIWKKSDPE